MLYEIVNVNVKARYRVQYSVVGLCEELKCVVRFIVIVNIFPALYKFEQENQAFRQIISNQDNIPTIYNDYFKINKANDATLSVT